MGFSEWWANLTGQGATPNATVGDPDSVGPDYRPGDPDGFEFEGAEPTNNRMAAIVTSPWDGWPATWATPSWQQGRFGDLVDSAWGAIDLNASVLSAMPVYRTRDGQVLPPKSWQTNPDPLIYTGWPEFMKQYAWDFQLGEAFVLPMARGADGWPTSFRVIPPWLVNVEMDGGGRSYKLGSMDVTGEILHVRYKSTTDSARGIGPLESGKNRVIAAGVLARYATEVAASGGIPYYYLYSERRLTKQESDDLLDQYWRAKVQDPGRPPVFSGGVKAERMQFTPEELGMVDLAQFNEGRIVNLLGVPPFLLGLPTPDSMTYSNANGMFDFHDRRSIKTMAVHLMSALSGWALPRGQQVELNRDEYTRPGLKERAEAYAILHEIQDETARGITAQEVRTMERLRGEGRAADVSDLEEQLAPAALTGAQE